MLAAQAHQHASAWCMDKPKANSPNIADLMFFPVVSFELILVSVEQSLRLLLLLHFSIFPEDPNHDVSALYKTVQDKSAGKEEICRDLIRTMNACGTIRDISPISEKELIACLNKHRYSYSNLKYFQVNKKGGLNKNFGFFPRDVQIVHCLALALIKLNINNMEKHAFNPPSLIPVPESEMTEELKAVKKQMLSFSPLDT